MAGMLAPSSEGESGESFFGLPSVDGSAELAEGGAEANPDEEDEEEPHTPRMACIASRS